MPKSQGSKRKDRNSSGNNGGLDTPLSGLLNQINSVLYGSGTELSQTMDSCEFGGKWRKVSDFEKEIRKVWVTIEDREKNNLGAQLVDMVSILMGTRRDELHEEVTYLQSQSMRNKNIVKQCTETAEVTKRKLREHMQTALKLCKDITDFIRFERVHRSSGHPITGKNRNIVTKFTEQNRTEHILYM
ncbi:hypothetical protein DPMN_116128 [Dreissena polymorpha]|uniref:Uncharacterized protein n=1 Tax=Dreissena polymorpha TaxID=45954 RepID=A0A9D4KN83_DREPO|nr:hypothetical protein DPMN_116128 [Dreissena polymorpha]